MVSMLQNIICYQQLFEQNMYRHKLHILDKGPVVAVLLEYDALPVIGHGCGHNLISEAGVAASIGIKAVMEADPTIVGKLVVLGTPAEEGGGGKVQLIKKGAFKDIDVAMMVHPRKFTIFAPPTLSKINCVIDFKGKESHASAFPWEGLNALDAAVCFYQSIGLLRQQIKPSYRLHAIITKGGTAPNIIPAEAQLKMYIRAPTRNEVYELKAKVEKCMQGAATSTGCTYSAQFDEENCYENLITNPVLGKLFGKFSEQLGLPECDTMKEIPAGSTDMGNVSHVVPSIHPVYDIETNAANHTIEFADASYSTKAQAPTLIAAKSMAMTALTLFRHPEVLAQVQAEFLAQRTLK
ncbi:xaa-Arg dipeptidase isoform X2 [Parasteatoda tepidariorum]|uniref:xaa-Arg dipeptidase isoform X2 n=1 Tax=Parasteatoda tepidariorum TaxID=114398 RepID=UPI0039BCDE5D